MKELFFICLLSVSQNVIAQIVIGKNIEQKRFYQFASYAIIRNSIKNRLINLSRTVFVVERNLIKKYEKSVC